jgi:hypothetical protein
MFKVEVFEDTEIIIPEDEASESSFTDAPGPSNSSSLALLDGTYFKQLPEESTGNLITAVCIKCTNKVRGYHNCTSNFLTHLKRMHGEKSVEEYNKYKKQRSKKKTRKSVTIGNKPKNIESDRQKYQFLMTKSSSILLIL